jgi:hypothetical protein
MCQYGNCHEQDKLPVQVSTGNGEQRARFCSEFHAALWLLKWAIAREQNVNRRLSALALLDVAFKE